jgi:plasmid stabilization system protein ParE
VSIPVRPSSFAQEEIEYYLRRYAEDSSALSARLWQDIQYIVDRISEYPDIGETVRRTRNMVRRVPLRHFPFLLLYRRRDDYLQIVALAHTSRKPSYWRARLELD